MSLALVFFSKYAKGISPTDQRRRPVLRVAVASAAAMSLLISGCSDGSTDNDAQVPAGDEVTPTVLATIGIWSDIVSNVGCGELVELETIIPIGGDPHSYEPSLQDRARMDGAALVVANGLELEERLEDTLDAVEDAGTPVYRAAEQTTTIPFSEGIGGHHGGEVDHGDEEGGEVDHGDEEGGEVDHGDEEGGHGAAGNPHVWFDPLRISETLPELAHRLVEDVGLDADSVETCLSTYQAELAELDSEISSLLAKVPVENRKLVTNHDALAYFADRYGFEIIGTVIPVPTARAETNPAQLEALAQVIEREGVPAIFAETQHTTADIDALARRVGDVEVVTLYTGSLGPPGSGAEDYLGFMRTNAQLISDALA